MDDEQELIDLFALRYALGRRTYAVGVVVEHILNNLAHYSKRAIDAFIRSIEDCRDYGDKNIDKPQWMKLYNILKEWRTENEKYNRDR